MLPLTIEVFLRQSGRKGEGGKEVERVEKRSDGVQKKYFKFTSSGDKGCAIHMLNLSRRGRTSPRTKKERHFEVFFQNDCC